MKETNYFIFRCSNSRRKSGAYSFKVPQGEDEWNSEMRKDTEGENRKKKKSSSVKYITLNINLLFYTYFL